MNLWQQITNAAPSPLIALADKRWAAKGVQLFIKRDDLLAPIAGDPFCGNKWRKLKYNLTYAQENGISTLLSFGGAYSNHIAALASAGRLLGFQTIGIIRGEHVNNHTLNRAREDGMQLHFMDRASYRKKKEEDFLATIQNKYGPCYIIPEGGTNALALKGAVELTKEIQHQCTGVTHIVSACGTGGTLAGMIQGLGNTPTKAIGISVLKGDFMTKEVSSLLQEYGGSTPTNWEVKEKYHHGGYAKKSKELLVFMERFQKQHNIQLEPIYTGKLFYALDQMLAEDYFSKGSKVAAVHTGGLQGLLLPASADGLK